MTSSDVIRNWKDKQIGFSKIKFKHIGIRDHCDDPLIDVTAESAGATGKQVSMEFRPAPFPIRYIKKSCFAAYAQWIKKLIEENLLDAVIGLPDKLFYGTGIPACIMVLNPARLDWVNYCG